MTYVCFVYFAAIAQVCIDLYTVMVWKGIQVPRGNIGKTTKKKRWRKRQSRSCRFSFHKHFTIFFHLLLLFLYFIFFFYTFFTHEIYPHPHPHPGPTPTTHDLYPLPTTFSYTRFSGAAYPIHEYRVSQKFVPLITRDIIFDRNYTSAWNFLKMFTALMSTYIRKVNIRHALLCLLSRSEAFVAWNGISHVAWRARFSSRLVWAVFSDPEWF